MDVSASCESQLLQMGRKDQLASVYNKKGEEIHEKHDPLLSSFLRDNDDGRRIIKLSSAFFGTNDDKLTFNVSRRVESTFD